MTHTSMNSIMIRRQRIIARIIKTLEALKEKGITVEDLNNGEMELEIWTQYGCSERKAKEYMKIGIANFKQMERLDEAW